MKPDKLKTGRSATGPNKRQINSSGRSATEPDKRHWYFLGAGLALWSCWQVSTAIGVFLGAQVPPSWSLDFTLPLTFIALVIPALVDRPAVAAALTAGIVGVIGANWPYKTGLVAAALIGIGVGTWLDARQGARGQRGNDAETTDRRD